MALKLLLALIFLENVAYCTEYYVKPEDSFISCPSQPCLMLSEYLQDPTMYFTSGSTFTLLQGQHLLNQTMTLSGVTNITLRGDETETAEIKLHFGNIRFNYSRKIKISSLKIYVGINLNFYKSTLKISNVQFVGANKVLHLDSITISQSTATLVDCSFTRFQSMFGGVLTIINSNVSFSGNTTFTNNTALELGGSIYIVFSSLNFNGTNTFMRNHYVNSGGAGLYGRESSIQLEGVTIFNQNGPTDKDNELLDDGGSSIYLERSTLRILNKAVLENNNRAIYATTSVIMLKGEIKFKKNSVAFSGGAIYIQNSTLLCFGNITFANNSAVQGQGGAVNGIHSIINVTGSINFVKNTALEGGGLALVDQRKLNAKLVLHSPVNLTFSHNRAVSKGGALFYMNSDRNVHCSDYSDSCFFELEIKQPSILDTFVNFVQNRARAGKAIYGGSFESCELKVNGNSLLQTYLLKLRLFFNLSGNVSNHSYIDEYISMDPVKVELCENNCTYSCKLIQVQRGKAFNISVRAVGQDYMNVASKIRAYIKNDGESELTPQSHNIEKICKNITFHLNAKASNNTLVLHPDGPCSHRQIEIAVVLAPCPPAFNLKGIRCKCDKNLQKLSDIVVCDNENLAIARLGNSWISPLWSDNGSYVGFTYHTSCPPGYCKPEKEVMIFTFSPTVSNALCTSNRTGLLCGGCNEGFSLTLNRFNCKECPNRYITLVIFFGFAGVALIAILLALHMTVAAGTINGLILYANIVNVNSMVFFPRNNTNILTVFIAWLNLEFGFETCFYDGDIYSYAWLQYTFPFYLWFLIGMIIWSNRLSAKVGKLFGSNPVAVLATVTLMSYTKLLQVTILTLSSTTLVFSNETSRKVWLYDANITYFKGKHIILTLLALCVISLLLIPFFFLMFFGYCLQAYSGKRAFVWFNKFKPLLDAYYAPYHPKMRFWPGFMLLVRGFLYMVIALSNSDSIKLIAISSVFISIVALPRRVYEKFYNNILETSFILNLCLLSAATYHVKYVNGKQEIATYLSISVALFQFIGIVCFHVCLQLKSTKLANLVCKKATYLIQKPNTEKTLAKGVSSTVVELREPLLDSTEN